MNPVAGLGLARRPAADHVVREAAVGHVGEVDAEKAILDAIVIDRTAAHVIRFDRGPILDKARSNVAQDQPAHGDIVCGDKKERVFPFSVEDGRAVTDQRDSLVDGDEWLSIETGVNDDRVPITRRGDARSDGLVRSRRGEVDPPLCGERHRHDQAEERDDSHCRSPHRLMAPASITPSAAASRADATAANPRPTPGDDPRRRR